MTAAATTVTTIADVESLAGDGCRYDLLRGELIQMSPAGRRHGRTAGQISKHLGSWIDDHDLGEWYTAETGFVLARDPDVLLAPDFSFVRSERLPLNEEGYLELAPDLVVEVVSPSDRWSQINDKVLSWLEAGVRLVLIVDPVGKTVTVWTPDRVSRVLAATETLDGGDVLPGFVLPISRIFE